MFCRFVEQQTFRTLPLIRCIIHHTLSDKKWEQSGKPSEGRNSVLQIGKTIHEWTKQIYGRQPLKNLKRYGLFKHIISDFLKAVFHKSCFTHS